ncbi:18873_t:CDS:2, partial [Racocetra fulgida]
NRVKFSYTTENRAPKMGHAVVNHFKTLLNKNSHSVVTNNESTPPNFGQNIQPNGIFIGNDLNNVPTLPNLNQENENSVENFLNNEQSLSNESFYGRGYLTTYNEQFPQESLTTDLFDNNLVINDLVINDLVTNEEQILQMQCEDFTGNFSTSNEQAFPEDRLSRTTSIQYPLHRSSSRDKRQKRQEVRNREPVSHPNISRSPSPNYMTSNISRSPISTSVHVSSPNNPFEIFSNPSSPLSNLDDMNLTNSITDMSFNSNSEE